MYIQGKLSMKWSSIFTCLYYTYIIFKIVQYLWINRDGLSVQQGFKLGQNKHCSPYLKYYKPPIHLETIKMNWWHTKKLPPIIMSFESTTSPCRGSKVHNKCSTWAKMVKNSDIGTNQPFMGSYYNGVVLLKQIMIAGKSFLVFHLFIYYWFWVNYITHTLGIQSPLHMWSIAIITYYKQCRNSFSVWYLSIIILKSIRGL